MERINTESVIGKYTRRRVQLHRKIRLLFFSLAVMTLAIGSLSGFSRPLAYSQPGEKYFRTVRVEKGDTLWEIASENKPEQYSSVRSYMKDIEEFNHIGTNIYAGQTLLIPSYAGAKN